MRDLLKAPGHLVRLFVLVVRLVREDALSLLSPVAAARPLIRLTRPFVRRDDERPGQRLAKALRAMGPSFVKLGQSLATRGDLIGEDVARDLSRLQDRMPPFAFAEVEAIVEGDLGAPLDVLFATFAPTAHAAASIAQVHFATTPNGAAVAVKVLRPGIERAVRRDLDFLGFLARLLAFVQPGLAERLDPVAVVGVLERQTVNELDLRLEAAAAAKLAHNCRYDPGFRVPSVDWTRTSRRVATFERIVGLRVTERERLVADGVDPSAVMRRAAVVFFHQIFRDGYFHGDMHPGNMLIEADGTVVALDFGIMGRLSLDDRRAIATMFWGFMDRDYARAANAFFDAGFLPPHQDRAAFAEACRAVGEPIIGLPLDEVSFGKLLGEVLTLAERFEMRAKPDLFLLQKTIVVAEGVGRILDPKINIWTTTEPLIEAWAARHLGPRAAIETGAREALDLVKRLPALVARAERVLVQIEEAPKGVGWVWPLAIGLVVGGGIGLVLGLL